MKATLKLKLLWTLFLTLLLISFSAKADGNHSWAKSEAWTWMGHVQYVDQKSARWSLESDGFGFIHYFTRNETGYGRMNFKSSAVTTTRNKMGLTYDQATLFPEPTWHSTFQLKVNEDKLALDFKFKNQHDQIEEVPFTPTDEILLSEKLLPLFPGLSIPTNWRIQKVLFKATLGTNSTVDLVFYSIWPDIAPPEQKMTFFGLENSFTFSSPMLVTYGDWSIKGIPPRRVCGLSFLDRQWSKEYFGKNIFNDPTKVMHVQKALSWAHNWSAFHAYAEGEKNWYFVHLWKQLKRQETQADLTAPYTGILWSKNGEQQISIDESNFEWTPRKFILNKSNVLINFAEGRDAYFPFTYDLQSQPAGFLLHIEASPQLQSLDQPIYLYEGYAQGQGLIEGLPVQVQGRMESSQILFRDVDYSEILSTIDITTPDQQKIADQLALQLSESTSSKTAREKRRAESRYLFNNLPLKLQIFESQYLKRPKKINSYQIIYF